MKFQPGKSGNPSGRPKGVLNKQSNLSKLLESRAEEIINKVMELALDGDPIALRLCLERLIPKVKHRAIEVELPAYNDQNSICNITAILNQILAGNIAPDEGRKCIDLIEQQDKRMILERSPNIFILRDG
jgi:hypothetical protein